MSISPTAQKGGAAVLVVGGLVGVVGTGALVTASIAGIISAVSSAKLAAIAHSIMGISSYTAGGSLATMGLLIMISIIAFGVFLWKSGEKDRQFRHNYIGNENVEKKGSK